MKVLLLMPPYPKSKIFRKSMKHLGAVLPPLGIAYIAAVLEKEGHDVKIIDGPAQANIEGYGFDELRRDVSTFNPDVAGVSASLSQIDLAKEALKIVKEINPKVLTVVGGPLVSADPNALLGLKDADYGVYGEADLTFVKILEAYKKGKKLNGMEGVIWRDKGKVHFKKPELIINLDTIPMPARHLLKMHIYRPSPANYRRLPASTMMTSRGCPYKCIFCSRSIEGLAFRYHSAKRVVDEMEELQNKYKIRDVQMFDDTFTMVPQRTEDICKGIIERGIDIGWNCMTRVDRVTPELFRLMRRAGCYEVGFGIESGSERVLKFIKKEIEKDQVRRSVKWAHQAGIDARGFFMIGFPTETRAEILETIKFAKELNVDVAQFMVATPYPGTKMWEIAEQYGKINSEDWSNFTFYAPDKMPFSSNILSDKEVVHLYKKAYKSYYLRPLFLLRQALKIRSLDDIYRNWLAFKGISSF